MKSIKYKIDPFKESRMYPRIQDVIVRSDRLILLELDESVGMINYDQMIDFLNNGEMNYEINKNRS
jgi:hypothetical protein